MGMSPSPTSALIVGCGYLGRRVAAAWVGAGRPVFALTRGKAESLAALGVTPVVGDVTDPTSLRNLPRVETVLYAVGLDRSAGKPMRAVYVDGLRNVLTALPRPDRFLYVSSTSVYGQTDGSVVDETSPTEPIEVSGQVVLEAERQLRVLRPEAVVLRFAGIYGPDRLLRKQALLAGEPLVGDADKWLNLIHVADGVRAIQAAEERAVDGETYLIADDTPVRRRDFYAHLAALLGAPAARFEPHPPGVAPPPEPNRRVNNRPTRERLGFVPQHPSYVEGLAASL
jgi:nucleoside-diphosphate-sugar epimerase